MKNDIKIAIIALSTIILSQGAYALPTGGTVTNGTAAIVTTGKTININQTTNRADIDWKTFGAGANEKINFNQLNSSSITINRVTGGQRSVFAGTSSITAPGRVVILNQAGLTINKGAQVNVGALVASTAKNYTFDNNRLTLLNLSNATIINNGTIKTAPNGFVNIVAAKVQNAGEIDVGNGNINLVSATGGQMYVDDGYFTYQVNPNEKGATATGITNTGHLTGKGINITSQQLNNIHAGAINLSGIVDVTDLGSLDVNSSGALTSKAQVNANGGTITTVAAGTNSFGGKYSAKNVNIRGGDIVYNGQIASTGTDSNVYIASSNNLTIANGAKPAAAAKNTLYQNDIQNITANAGSTSIYTSGDITVKDLKNDSLAAGNSFYVSGNNVKVTDTKDTISSKNGAVVVFARGDVTTGDLRANKSVGVASSTGNVTTGAINAGDSVNVASYAAGNITTGNINVGKSVIAPNTSSNVGIAVNSYGGNVKTGDLSVYTNVSNFGNIPNQSSGYVYASSDTNYLTGKRGDVSVGNINVSTRYASNYSTPNNGTALTDVSLAGNNVSAKNITARADATYGGLGSVTVTEKADNKLTQMGDIRAVSTSPSSGLINIELNSGKEKIDSGATNINDRIIAQSVNSKTGVTTTRYPSTSLVQVSVKEPQ